MARFAVLAVLTVAVVSFPGCAAVGLTALGIVGGAGVGYTMDSIAYKTFTAPVEGVQSALTMALTRMDIAVVESRDVESGRAITAKAGDRDIDIELDRLTTRTTRMRVVVKKNWLVKDRATATEIILQTDQVLSDHPHLAAAPAASGAASARTAIPPRTPAKRQ